jgi:hypothetical protein
MSSIVSSNPFYQSWIESYQTPGTTDERTFGSFLTSFFSYHAFDRLTEQSSLYWSLFRLPKRVQSVLRPGWGKKESFSPNFQLASRISDATEERILKKSVPTSDRNEMLRLLPVESVTGNK